MRAITLLGGTSWPSTIEYYRYLNETVSAKRGGFHSARLVLHSVDYHDIKSNYKDDWDKIPGQLKSEIEICMKAGAECLIICNNTLHKAFDVIENDLNLTIPVFHAVRLTVEEAVNQGYKRVLLLATKSTMEDGFYQQALAAQGIETVIPTLVEREEIQLIQSALAEGKSGQKHSEYMAFFSGLIGLHAELDAVILGCTELPLVVTEASSALPILNPLELQCDAAINWALA